MLLIFENGKSFSILKLKKQVEAKLPTYWGNFNIIAYADSNENLMPHIVLVHEDADLSQPIHVRIHSECMTGDVFGSKRCDCGEQLEKALQIIGHQKGIIIYLRQEGRGIGIINKLKAYNLQDLGADTIQANIQLGFSADERLYDDAIAILQDLDVSQIYLLTNNPDKINSLELNGIKVVERIPLIVSPLPENEAYFMTKANNMGHLFNGLFSNHHQF